MSVYIVARKNTSRPTTYHVRWSKGRYEPYVYLGSLDTKKRAEARKHKALDLLAIGIEPTLEMFKHVSASDGPAVRLVEVCDDWMASQVQWSETTRKARKSYVKSIVGYYGDIVPTRLTVEDVQRWIGSMIEDGLLPTTMKSRITAMGQILKHAKHPANPVLSPDLNRPKGKARRRPMPRIAELAAAQAALSKEDDRRMFATLEHTGARPTEISTLTWSQVDNLRDRLVDVGGGEAAGASKTFARIIERLPGQPAWVPVKPEGADPDGLVFNGRTSRQFAKALEDACRRIEADHLNPYRLRHVHASRLLAGEQGGGLATTMGTADMAYRMGHSIEEFLKTYTHRIPPEA